MPAGVPDTVRIILLTRRPGVGAAAQDDADVVIDRGWVDEIDADVAAADKIVEVTQGRLVIDLTYACGYLTQGALPGWFL